MRSSVRAALCAGALLLLGACASAVTGPTQAVRVQTTPTAGAQCQLVNDKGSWTVAPTPASTTINRSGSDLVVKCNHPDGATGSTAIKSSLNPAVAGNVLIGGVIGIVADAASGAAFEYPQAIMVAMEPGAARPPPAETPAGADNAGNGSAGGGASAVLQRQLALLSDLREKKLIPDEEYHRRVRMLLDEELAAIAIQPPVVAPVAAPAKPPPPAPATAATPSPPPAPAPAPAEPQPAHAGMPAPTPQQVALKRERTKAESEAYVRENWRAMQRSIESFVRANNHEFLPYAHTYGGTTVNVRGMDLREIREVESDIVDIDVLLHMNNYSSSNVTRASAFRIQMRNRAPDFPVQSFAYLDLKS